MSTMAWVTRLRALLAEPRLAGCDTESPQRLVAHRQILSEKPLMRQVFREFYETCRALDDRFFSGVGDRIEIGAGASRFKDYYPDVISTDIAAADHLDGVLDAEDMDLPSSSVRAIYGVNCFHHFPRPELFFSELRRVLLPGGGCVLIEPFYGPLAAAFYRRVFESEHFDKSQTSWSGTSGMGVMKGANQALSYLVFKRDRDRFMSTYADLEIVHEDVFTNYLRYVLSGGLNFRQLVPTRAGALLSGIEKMLSPLRRWIGLHHIVVLRKIGRGP